MGETIDTISSLSPEQLELLMLRLEKFGKGNGGPRANRIPPRQATSPNCPLTLSQLGYWVQEQLNPDRTNLNITTARHIEGPLDAAALDQALSKVVERQEVLRTTFQIIEGQPWQIIAPASTAKFERVDLSDLRADQLESAALHLVAEEPRLPFDLTQSPPLRAKLVRLTDRRHIMLLTVHHIACDKWSHGLLMRELLACYKAFVEGVSPALPQLPIQYADFAVWQQEWLKSEEMDRQLAYWKKQLENAPARANLPTDRARTPGQPAHIRKHRFSFSEELTGKIKSFGQREEVTLFIVLLAAFKALLHRFTGEDDLVVGSLFANRQRPEVKDLIGQFANTVVLRTRLAAGTSFGQLLRQLFETLTEAHANQDLPFEKLVQELQPEREAGRPPFFRVVINLQKAPLAEGSLPGLEINSIDISQELTTLDFLWLFEETEQGLSAVLEYNAELFDHETIEQLVESYSQILSAAIRRPETTLAELPFSDQLQAKARAAIAREQKPTLAIAATFTAEPVEDSLTFWMQELALPAQIKFAPYNQVLQQLLDPASLLGRNESGVNVVLVRLDDLASPASEGAARDDLGAELEQRIERNMADLASALQSAAEQAKVPFIVCLCPAAPSPPGEVRREEFFRRMEHLLELRLAGANNLCLISTAELAEFYPVREYFDELRDKLGHVSYTPAFFAAVGTMVARKINALQSRPYKVIVTDCDQTLWRGVCAEDGVAGIVVDDSSRALQEFLVACHDAGFLICLCSKNSERDVAEVFAQRTDMPLKRAHIAAWQINWRSKSENIRRLAEELDLALDSFIFLDDNPVECAEVMAELPAVAAIQLPAVADSLPTFLKHIWAFDRLKVTAEDKQRTAFYQQNVERERFSRQSLTLEEFLSGLNLQVEIAETTPSQAARVSQLTQRTNQFNTTSVRRSELEIQRLLKSGDHSCLSVTVKDRFGEYGLVGMATYTLQQNVLEVDSLMLSCRVLGKGVEHQLLAELGRRTVEKGLPYLNVACLATDRNQPVRDFLDNISAGFKEPRRDSYVYRLPSAVAAALTYRPSTMAASRRVVGDSSINQPTEPTETSAARAPEGQSRSDLFRRIATEMHEPEQILSLIESRQPRQTRRGPAGYAPPRTPVEEMLADLWAAVLRIDRAGIYDDFFKSGGHSLLGILLMSRIHQTFQVELPLSSLFEAPTIAGLAALIEEHILRQMDADTMSEMLQGVEQLTDAEAKALLTQEGLTRRKTVE